MEKNSLKFLKGLLDQAGPSGYEEQTSAVWRNYVQGFADRVHGDFHGNSYGILNEKGKTSIFMSGHIDEIGFMISGITEKGFLKIAPVGGIDLHVVVGQRVNINTKKGEVYGIIGRKPIHLLTPEERKKVATVSEIWVDIGAKDKKDAEKIVEIGDAVTIDVGFKKLRGSLYVARGFDDRVGAFAVAEALRILSENRDKLRHKVTAVASVQEEIGLRGAITSAYNVNPQIGFAVDVTFSSDVPEIKPEIIGDVKLGNGPVIARGPNINPKLFVLIKKVAKENKIPIQIVAVPRGTGTDANAIQLSRGGVATALISIPNRYMHTPVEVVSLKDVENTALLIAKTIMKIKNRDDFIL